MTSLTSTNPLANAPVTSQDAAVACAPTRGFDVTDAKPATIAGKKGYTCRTSAGTASGSRIDFAFLSANDRLFECILYEGAGHGTYDDFVAILRSFKLLATGTTAYPSSRASTANTFGYVLGTWVNNDAHTQSVTRIVIDARGGYYTVKPFSPCPTDECDWDATMVAPGAS